MKRTYQRIAAGITVISMALCYGAPAWASEMPSQADDQEVPRAQPAPPAGPPASAPAPSPQAGAPPPGYPPYYAPPPGYGPPPWTMGPRVPLRYEDRPRYGLAIAGGALWGGVYLTTALFTATFDGGLCGSGYNCNRNWALYIPLLGPFIDIGTARDTSPGAIPWLVLDGLAQTAGLAMLIGGLASRHKVPVYAQRVQLLPLATSGGGGLLAMGRF